MKTRYLSVVALLLGAFVLFSCHSTKEELVEARAVATGENYLEFAATQAAAQEIPVYADGTWAVDVEDAWISVSPTSGKGHGSITVSVADNATGGVIDLPRDGKITIQGGSRERNSVITVHQDGDTYYGVQEYTIAGLAELEDDAVAKIPTATVVAVCGTGFVLMDSTGLIYVQGAKDVKVGDTVSLNGAKKTLYSTPAFIVDEIEVTSSGTYDYPEAPDLSGAVSTYEGGTVVYGSLPGSMVNGVLKLGPASVQVLDPAEELGMEAVDLHKVVLTGYVVGIGGASGYFVATAVTDQGADETLVPYPLRWAMGKDLNYSSDTFNINNPRVEPIQGIGYIEYVPYDLENTNSAGNYKLDVSGNNLRVTGPWENDYWLFYGNGAIKAGSEVQIAFEMRSSAWGQKFWVLEYLDGQEWLTAPDVQYSNEPGYETPYHIATNADGSTNVPLMEVIKFRKNNDHLQIRMRCSANWRGGGQPMANPRTTASSRLTVTNVDDDTYKPNIIIIKEGNGVEKDPVYANIEVSTDILTFNGTPDAPKTLTIKSDYDFTVSTSSEWLSLDVQEGAANEETVITVTCEQSELPDLRQGTIRIVSEDSEKLVNVVQSAAGQILDPFISVSGGNTLNVGYAQGSSVVRIQTNTDVQCESLAPWLTVAPAETKALVEWKEYQVSFEENTEVLTPRSGVLRFYNEEENLETLLTVEQAGAPASGVYFEDDFEWLAPWTASAPDDISTNSVGSAQNLFTTAALAPALAELQNRGYGYVWGWQGQDWSDGIPDTGNKQTLYLMKNYLKFGKTSYNSGLILPALSRMTSTENVELSFDWAWCMTGASKPDIMTLTVTVTGGGVFADTGTETSLEITSDQPTEGDLTSLSWQHRSVIIRGATPATRITIRPTNTDPSISSTRKQNRWYLDNIKVEKSDYKYEYFSDDFSWFQDIADAAGAGDGVGEVNSGAASPNAYTFDTEGSTLFFSRFATLGYEDLNPAAKVIYLQKYYLKFSKNKNVGGIRLPAMAFGSIPVDAVLEFDWCAQMGGSGSVDGVSLNVELTGAGTCADSGAAVSSAIEHTQDTNQMFWQHVTIQLNGVTDDTRIEIKPTQFGATSGYYRWFLDNVRVTE